MKQAVGLQLETARCTQAFGLGLEFGHFPLDSETRMG